MQQSKFQSLTLKDEAYPVIKYTLPIGDTTTKCTPRAHADLMDAVRELDIHLAILTGQLPMPGENTSFGSLIADYVAEIELDAALKALLNNIMCSGFALSSDSSKVVLHGVRVLDNAKEISLSSPEQSFKMDTYVYPYINELAETVEKIKYELSEYLERGKVWVNPQGDLFNEEENQVKLSESTKRAVKNFKKTMDDMGAEVVFGAEQTKKGGRKKKEEAATSEANWEDETKEPE